MAVDTKLDPFQAATDIFFIVCLEDLSRDFYNPLMVLIFRIQLYYQEKNILTIEVADIFFAGCPKDDLGHFDYKCNCSLAGNATVGFIREFMFQWSTYLLNLASFSKNDRNCWPPKSNFDYNCNLAGSLKSYNLMLDIPLLVRLIYTLRSDLKGTL